jgi:anaerobic selenocysteine-containing dehydrogenase
MTVPAEAVVRSSCRMCHGGCGVRVHVRDGRVERVEGDPHCLTNLGYLCAKGQASVAYTYHPDRLLHPLRRVGPRGEGGWERISWEAALDEVAGRLDDVRRTHGPEYVAKACGTGREWNTFGERFFNAFGTSLNVGRSPLCYFLRVATSRLALGTRIPVADFYGFEGQLPRCVLVWGNDPFNSADGMIGGRLLPALRAGATLIVVDPVRTAAARRAQTFLQIRPLTDAALALGMLHVIVGEGLFDREFVARWTNAPFLVGEEDGRLLTDADGRFLAWDEGVGAARPVGPGTAGAIDGEYVVDGVACRPAWRRLVDRVAAYPPERVAAVTGLRAADIVAAARAFATTRPACIQWGNALDVQGVNSSSVVHALLILMTITGNLDVPGGMAIWEHGPWIDAFDPEHTRPDLLPPRSLALADRYGRRDFPTLGSSHASLVNQAIVSGELAVQALIVVGHNFLVSAEDTPLTWRLVQKIPFVVALDLFMTPTTRMADVVLPVATWLERDALNGQHFGWGFLCRQKVVEPAGEARPDEWIFLELARRLGLGAHFPWKDLDDYHDWRLARAGITWREFKERGELRSPLRYRKYLTDHYRAGGGFPTPTGRVEVYQTAFQRHGADPLPSYVPPTAAQEVSDAFPLLLTNRRAAAYFHSEYRQVRQLRRLCPDPRLEIHPDTAGPLGIAEGDWVWLDTAHGEIRQRAHVTASILPGVVTAQHAWWFPERPDLFYGLWDSNLNVVTTADRSQGFDPLYGSPRLRGLPCRVRRADGPPAAATTPPV